MKITQGMLPLRSAGGSKIIMWGLSLEIWELMQVLRTIYDCDLVS